MMLIDALSNISALSGTFFLFGFILVVIEMFIPGFGVPGITGGIFLILGIIFTAESVAQAAVLIATVLIILLAAFGMILYLMSKGKVKGIVLSDRLDKKAGYIGTENLEKYLGHSGVTLTVLRPSGIADFNGTKVDVVSEGEYLEKGTNVRVIKIDSGKIIVRAQE